VRTSVGGFRGSGGRIQLLWGRLPDSISRWVEPITFIGLLILLVFNAVRFSLPMGYAGLYTLMVEQVIKKPWPVPTEVPLYGPGGIPFAYPPLGAYVAAGFVRLTGIPIFEYLRWAPPFLTLLALGLFYLFLREFYDDRDKAIVGVILAAIGSHLYVDHATAAGIIRGLALLLSAAGLAAFTASSRRSTVLNEWTVASGVLLGLTLLTHLSYFGFALLGMTAVGFFSGGGPGSARFRRLLIVGIVCSIVSIPWVALIVTRYGTLAFVYASQTHGTFGIIQRASGNPLRVPVELLGWLANFGRDWGPRSLGGLGLVGIGYALLKRRWTLPVWLAILSSVLGETLRFEEILGAALAAGCLIDLVPLRATSGRKPVRFESLANVGFYAIVVGALAYQGAKAIYQDEPSLSQPLIQVAAWVDSTTPDDSVVLMLPNDHAVSEWTPYLTRRQLGVGHWGAEWTGKYAYQQALQDAISICSELQSLQCLLDWADELDPPPTHLIIRNSLSDLLSEARLDPDWVLVFENGDFSVFGSVNLAGPPY